MNAPGRARSGSACSVVPPCRLGSDVELAWGGGENEN